MPQSDGGELGRAVVEDGRLGIVRVLRMKARSSYSPEMNPIEEVWSFFKNLMRRASARNLSNLVEALMNAMVAVTRELAGAFFTHAGYAQFT